MGGADDDWVREAMDDDALVVEVLVRLHGAGPSRRTRAVPFEWTVRQRRSRSLSIVKNLKKATQRASPSTPLTWSGATSQSGGSAGSGGGGGYEESSGTPPAKHSAAARSKQLNGEKEPSNSKRSSKRKKTLSELREEEITLLKEQRELRKEITTLRVRLEKQTETNKKLNKIMNKLRPSQDQEAPSATRQKTEAISESHLMFILPDLNIPFEEEAPCPELICGAS